MQTLAQLVVVMVAVLEAPAQPPVYPGDVQAYTLTEAPKRLIGEIYVIGNDKTPTSVVLKYAGLHPGEPLSYPLLRLAEKWLAATDLFVVDEQEGVRPTITVIEGEEGGTYRDIMIVVKDKGHRRSRSR
jgi:hypothetical protein